MIKKGAYIGTRVIILQGVSLGERSIARAGSLVNKDISQRVVAVGVPAIVIKKKSNIDSCF